MEEETAKTIERAREDRAREISIRLADEIGKLLVQDFPENSKRNLLDSEQLVHISRAYLNSRDYFENFVKDPHANNVFADLSGSLIARAYVYGYLLGNTGQIKIEGGNE